MNVLIKENECGGISVCILFTEGENTQLHTNCIHRKILELASSVMLYMFCNEKKPTKYNNTYTTFRKTSKLNFI